MQHQQRPIDDPITEPIDDVTSHTDSPKKLLDLTGANYLLAEPASQTRDGRNMAWEKVEHAN